MSDSVASDFEGLLRQALAPIDPPADLAERVDATLTTLTDLAAEELERWELSAMRDPRNWPRQVARPAAAVAVGGVAGAALVVLRVRAGRGGRRAASANPLEYAGHTARAVAHEARRLLDR